MVVELWIVVSLVGTSVSGWNLLDAIALLATLWAIWRLPPVPPERAEGPARAGLREVVAGFRYAAMHKVLLVSFLGAVFGIGRTTGAGGWFRRADD